MSALVTPEGYADLCQTALTATYTAGAGSITVSSTGSPFPQVQQFHFAIKDQTTLAVKAVGKATAITSGTVWAVSMTTDANCNSGDLVQLVLAADAMDQIRKDMRQFGVFVSLPSTTGQKQGNSYKCTDVPYDYIFDGSSWQAYYRGRQCTPITTGNWTTLGSSGVRTNNADGTITVTGNTSGGSKIDGVSRTIPAGDFTHYFIVWPRTILAGNAAVLVGFTDGTKTEGGGVDAATTSSLEPNQLKNSAISGGTVAAANGVAAAFANVPVTCPLYFQVRRSGTALAVDISFDEGTTYLNLFNDTAPYLTASSLAVYIDSRTSTVAAGFTLISSSLV